MWGGLEGEGESEHELVPFQKPLWSLNPSQLNSEKRQRGINIWSRHLATQECEFQMPLIFSDAKHSNDVKYSELF